MKAPLDNLAQKEIIEDLISSKIKVTIIMVAHRIDSIKNCERIIVISNGKIESEGSYQYLRENSIIFQSISSFS